MTKDKLINLSIHNIQIKLTKFKLISQSQDYIHKSKTSIKIEFF